MVVSAFNSLSQRVFCMLKEGGYDVSVEFALSAKAIREAFNSWKPDVILSPYLLQKIPEDIWSKVPVLILHPGPLGDRGPSSLDWAVIKQEEIFGVTLLQANEIMDGGDIWGYSYYNMPKNRSKASIYRDEVTISAIELFKMALREFERDFTPLPQTNLKNIKWHIHNKMPQSIRAVNWDTDTTDDIIKKINSADNHPGVLDNIAGVKCYMYGASKEATLRGKPKEILAKRDGAICIGTTDAAVWISHLAEPDRFKLPSTYVLKNQIEGIKEHRIPLFVSPSLETFKEITFTKRDNIGYLYFDFYNGAMSSNQCIRLKYAIETLREEVDILVLMGGKNFFSNGIHLAILQDSKKQGEDGWSNINAMNNLISTILYSDDILTVASFGANAGAGGVFLGLACDIVVAKEGVVLNPHYKTIGLSGSEYHTYTLPKRVGRKLAKSLTDNMLPISANYAKSIGMIDEVFKDYQVDIRDYEAVIDKKDYETQLHNYLKDIVENEDRYYDMIDAKRENLEADDEIIQRCKEEELNRMYPEFWEKDSLFHKLRYEFIYKIPKEYAPKHLALHKKV